MLRFGNPARCTALAVLVLLAACELFEPGGERGGAVTGADPVELARQIETHLADDPCAMSYTIEVRRVSRTGVASGERLDVRAEVVLTQNAAQGDLPPGACTRSLGGGEHTSAAWIQIGESRPRPSPTRPER